MAPTFFETPAAFRRWLAKHHAREAELLVGFWKRGSGKPSITWPESVDEALCFGWIDGVRKRIDDESYTIRFSPRRKGSIWSRINIKRATELIELGRMQAAGLRAYEQRDEQKTAVYAYENRPREWPPEMEKQFRANRKAWSYFTAQAPSYQRVCIFYVTSAKQEATRAKRLENLITCSAEGRRI